MAHKDTSSTVRSTVSGFDLAWFSSLSSKRLCVFGLNGAIEILNFFLLISFSLPFSELRLVGLAFDVEPSSFSAMMLLVGSCDP